MDETNIVQASVRPVLGAATYALARLLFHRTEFSLGRVAVPALTYGLTLSAADLALRQARPPNPGAREALITPTAAAAAALVYPALENLLLGKGLGWDPAAGYWSLAAGLGSGNAVNWLRADGTTDAPAQGLSGIGERTLGKAMAAAVLSASAVKVSNPETSVGNGLLFVWAMIAFGLTSEFTNAALTVQSDMPDAYKVAIERLGDVGAFGLLYPSALALINVRSGTSFADWTRRAFLATSVAAATNGTTNWADINPRGR